MHKKAPNPGIELKEKSWQLEFHQKPAKRMKSYPPVVRDKKPVRMTIVKGKQYKWCSCGFSGLQVGYINIYYIYKIDFPKYEVIQLA